jgi:hypothetical protein
LIRSVVIFEDKDLEVLFGNVTAENLTGPIVGLKNKGVVRS